MVSYYSTTIRLDSPHYQYSVSVYQYTFFIEDTNKGIPLVGKCCGIDITTLSDM